MAASRAAVVRSKGGTRATAPGGGIKAKDDKEEERIGGDRK